MHNCVVINNTQINEHTTFGSTHYGHEPHTVFYAGNIDCRYSAMPAFEFVPCFAVTVRRHVQSGGHRDRDLDRMFRMRENATNLNPRCRY